MLLGAFDGELCLCDWLDNPHRKRNDSRVCQLLSAEFQVLEATSLCHHVCAASSEVSSDFSVLVRARQELEEYFAGSRTSFDIPLCLVGTDFQKAVWKMLLEIPYGHVVSYMNIAERLGKAKGVRAVSQAIGANALSIFIPCHRVLGSNGSLTGYAGGLEAKRCLLELEKGHKGAQKNINVW